LWVGMGGRHYDFHGSYGDGKICSSPLLLIFFIKYLLHFYFNSHSFK